ncbi:VWA domain-containing protein [Phanerochaete sordida]|uniref:VWA domain-containing protein n=1 Tax=Phanerochaete sordida TaxID=48140 RepID=A0A9P3FYF3_9APHY|nr:VWA domain-containing protein [Phanerochaete sordida]
MAEFLSTAAGSAHDRSPSRLSSRSQRSTRSAESSKQDYSKEHDAKEDHFDVPFDAPPAYSASSSRRPAQSAAEDPLELLRQFNTVIILDDSTSMSYSKSQTGNGTLWDEAKNALVSLAVTAARYDDDGIDIHFLNNHKVGRNLKTRADVEAVFSGITTIQGTPIATRLDFVIREYFKEFEDWQKPPTRNLFGRKKEKKPLKKLNILVITDGYPTDEPKRVIADLAGQMDRLHMEYNRVGIQFVQIGDDKNAQRYLQELDNDMQQHSAMRDIIDTTRYADGPLDADPETIVKILLGGIHRRIDSEGAGVMFKDEERDHSEKAR